MTSLHHFIENFLLNWICISLVLLTYRCSAITRIVANTEEVSTCVVAAIRLGLIGACSVGSSKATVTEGLGIGSGWTLQ